MSSPSCQALTPEKLHNIPHQPGVYLMRDGSATILYVGKARDLRNRVSSYRKLSSALSHNKTRALLSHVTDIETILTTTEKEALLLEASLIKKYRPRYNIILRDDKNYPSIKVTVQEQWPRLLMTRRRKKDGARYFGPFSSSSAMWSTIHHLRNIFPLRNCKGGEPKKRGRPCLNFQLGRCLAPCAGLADRQQYDDTVSNILMILEGRNREVINSLQRQMSAAAENLDFEKAAILRDRLEALHNTLEKQIIVSDHFLNQDVFGFHRSNQSMGISIMRIQHGLLNGSHSFYIDESIGDDQDIVAEVLRRFYDDNRTIPDEIVLPLSLQDKNVLEELLSEKKEKKVSLSVPQRGDKMKLLRMASSNAKQVVTEKRDSRAAWQKMAAVTKGILHLQRLPDRIDCLDISNFSGRNAVGSLISFYQGKKDPGNYRHYRIATINGPDDYGMMREVLERRFAKDEPESWPDLLLIDGGKGHLNVAAAVINQLNPLKRPDICAIAKEKKDEGEKLYRPGRKNPLRIAAHSPVLLYLMRIRDEAHRFGITTHRNWRRKKTLASELDPIPGIGPARKKNLLQALGSVKAISKASLPELSAVDGISAKTAETVYNYFKNR